MSTAEIDPTNLKKYNVICMNQDWCDAFDLAASDIDNAEATAADVIIYKANWSYITDPDESGEPGDYYMTFITDAQLDANAIPIFDNNSTANYFVINFRGGTDQRKAFCGMMGASASGQTNGDSVQNWTAWMMDKFDKLCRWVATSDRRLR